MARVLSPRGERKKKERRKPESRAEGTALVTLDTGFRRYDGKQCKT
jgi:hypothetical protein